MREIRPNADRTVTDAPGCVWTLGAFFVVISSILMLGPLGLFTNNDEVSAWARALAVLMGAVGVAAGAFVIYTTPRVTATVEVARRRVVVRTIGFSGSSERAIDAAEVVAVEVASRPDNDGDATYRPELVLRSGERVGLSSVWRSTRVPADRRVDAVRRAFAEGLGRELRGLARVRTDGLKAGGAAKAGDGSLGRDPAVNGRARGPKG